MSELMHGPRSEGAKKVAVIDDDGNEIEIAIDEYWQFEQDAMRYRADNNEEGDK